QGPPFGNAVVDSVTTVPAGSPANVGTWFDGTDVHFSFELPQGDPGEQGPGGEVSQGDLENAINLLTSNYTNGVTNLGLSPSDPPTQNDVQQIVDKLDELINALRR
ncbi:MAG: FIVAR domain-containing protein, partial [Verrucomicrobiales bacterium]|nr:FIVAR domain-containing protein [Verrucomicrobiales bacterium]